MIDEIISVTGQMLQMLLWASWTMLKIIAKAVYIFFTEHTRYLFLVAIIFIAFFCRDNLLFTHSSHIELAKQDMEIAEKQLDGKLSIIGGDVLPGEFAMGPIYNWIIAPFLWYNSFTPLGPARLAFALQIGTVILLFLAGKRFFSYQAGIFAAGLYAVSPLVFSFAYQSWRLDILPFFVLLLMLVLFNASASARPFFTYLAVGLLLGITLQLHYAALFLGFLVFLYVLITDISLFKRQFLLQFMRHYLAIGLGFILVYAPFLWSEYTHQFEQTQALITLLMNSAPSFKLNTFYEFYARLVVHYPAVTETVKNASSQTLFLGIFAMIVAVGSFIELIFTKNRFVTLLCALWVVLGVVYFSVFQKVIFEYHFSPLYPVFFLLVGNLLASFYHLQDQERTKMAKQLISSNAESETYTTIPVDVTDNKKLALHYLCVTGSVLLFLLLFFLNFASFLLQD